MDLSFSVGGDIAALSINPIARYCDSVLEPVPTCRPDPTFAPPTTRHLSHYEIEPLHRTSLDVGAMRAKSF
jgi:hypothetical protein